MSSHCYTAQPSGIEDHRRNAVHALCSEAAARLDEIKLSESGEEFKKAQSYLDEIIDEIASIKGRSGT